jgi:MFS family permease
MNISTFVLARFYAYGCIKNLVFFEPFLILYLRENGLSFLQIGILIAIRECTTMLVEIPTGIIADVMGRRKALVGAFLSYIFSFILFYQFSDMLILTGAMIAFGIGEAFRSGTHKAMVMEYLDIVGKHKGDVIRVMSRIRAWSQIGAAFSTLVAAGLVFAVGSYKIVFLASVFPYIIGALVVLSYPRELDGKITIKKDVKSVWDFVLGSLRNMIGKKQLRQMLLNSALDKGLYKALKDYLQPVVATSALFLLPFLPSVFPHIDEKQVIAIAIAVIYFSIYVLNSVAAMQSVRLENGLGGSRHALNILYAIYLVVILMGFVAMIYQLWWLAIFGFVVLGGIQNARRPILLSCLAKYMPSQERATVMSVETQTQTVITMLVAPVLGLIADAFGLQYVFLMSFIIFAVVGYAVRIQKEHCV